MLGQRFPELHLCLKQFKNGFDITLIHDAAKLTQGQPGAGKIALPDFAEEPCELAWVVLL